MKKRTVALVIGLVFVLTPLADAQTMVFNFESGLGPNFDTWNDGNLWTIDSSGGEVRISKPEDDLSVLPGGIRGGAVSKFILTGDFSVTVDYNLYNFPADLSHSETYPHIALRLDHNDFIGTNDNFAVIRFRQYTSQEIEAWHLPPGSIYGRQSAPADMLASGRMRLTRAGSAISSFYAPLGSEAFTLLGSAPGVSDPLHVRLLAGQWRTSVLVPTRANTAMDIAFDNLIVEGPVSGVVPEPGSLILLLSGLGVILLQIRRVRRAKS
jgi:hypothetical protein